MFTTDIGKFAKQYIDVEKRIFEILDAYNRVYAKNERFEFIGFSVKKENMDYHSVNISYYDREGIEGEHLIVPLDLLLRSDNKEALLLYFEERKASEDKATKEALYKWQKQMEEENLKKDLETYHYLKNKFDKVRL